MSEEFWTSKCGECIPVARIEEIARLSGLCITDVTDCLSVYFEEGMHQDCDNWPETNEEADRLAELDSERAEARRDDDLAEIGRLTQGEGHG